MSSNFCWWIYVQSFVIDIVSIFDVLINCKNWWCTTPFLFMQYLIFSFFIVGYGDSTNYQNTWEIILLSRILNNKCYLNPFIVDYLQSFFFLKLFESTTRTERQDNRKALKKIYIFSIPPSALRRLDLCVYFFF
jgi:hypothetical protein